MDVLERIRRGYRAIGHGASGDVLAMFHQEQPDPPRWVVDDSLKIVATRDVVAMDLFLGLVPPHWEVTGVDVRDWQFSARESRLVVTGRFRARPKGSWDVLRLPFVHVWSVDGHDQVRAVFDYLAGIEVKRLEDVRPRGLRRRRRSA
jgi:hypothetical protein